MNVISQYMRELEIFQQFYAIQAQNSKKNEEEQDVSYF